MKLPPKKVIQGLVNAALAEDVGTGDVTTLSTVPASAQVTAYMVARQKLAVSGLPVAVCAFKTVDSKIKIKALAEDGQCVEAGKRLLEISGPARGILSGERVALNFVQQLSGVATKTAEYMAAVAGTGVKILDTRKTTPGLRLLQKYAVACGGGTNHRIGLYDMVLIKDNHLAALRDAKPNAIAAAVQRARAKFPRLRVEVEADTLEQVQQAVEAGADIILLDNMKPATLRAAVKLVNGRAQTEASGGITLATIRSVAQTGVNFISVGALTHSAPAADVALDFA